MAMQITITFPCSAEEWKYLTTLNSLYASGSILADVNDIVHAGIKKGMEPVAMAPISNDSPLVELTDLEQKLLDEHMRATHEGGATSILDTLAVAGAGRLKPCISDEIIAYYTDHPGAGSADCKEYLANKLIAHYPSYSIATRRIGIIIGNLTFSGRLVNKGGHKKLAQYHVT